MTRPYFKRRPDEQTPLWAIHGEEPPISYRIEQQATPHDANGQAGFGEDVWKGVESFGRGIGRAGTHVFETMGATNEQNHQKANRANRVLGMVLKRAVTHPSETIEVLKKVGPVAQQYAQNHPGRILGRAIPGAAVSTLTKSGAIGIGTAAILGDLMHALKQGETRYDEVTRAILGGETSDYQ